MMVRTSEKKIDLPTFHARSTLSFFDDNLLMMPMSPKKRGRVGVLRVQHCRIRESEKSTHKTHNSSCLTWQLISLVDLHFITILKY